jgi:uncharacterized protein YbdZ (MbtH family)
LVSSWPTKPLTGIRKLPSQQSKCCSRRVRTRHVLKSESGIQIHVKRDSEQSSYWPTATVPSGHTASRQPGSTFSCLPCSRQVIYWSMIVGTPLAGPLFPCSFTGAPGNFSLFVVNFVI